ncbi:MAG: sigma-70 family RNA polymerase sigma factor [bacterium]|jgi:RNA polymerase sigma-70 factor (ECF subfamily)|nr:sigma-70 family RNA polymerase sigma factor [bacterium]
MRPEAELIQGIRRRDERIFEEFVRRYQQVIYFTSLRMLNTHEEALDAAQEVFLKIWRSAEVPKHEGYLKSWVYRVTINACIDRLRERRRGEGTKTLDNVIWLSIPADGLTPLQIAQQAEEFTRLRRAMDELTQRQRSIFVLRHFQNLKLQEIADILEIPIGTVKATLHQALLKLRALLVGATQEAPEARMQS